MEVNLRSVLHTPGCIWALFLARGATTIIVSLLIYALRPNWMKVDTFYFPVTKLSPLQRHVDSMLLLQDWHIWQEHSLHTRFKSIYIMRWCYKKNDHRKIIESLNRKDFEQKHMVEMYVYTYSKTSSFFFLTILILHYKSSNNHKMKSSKLQRSRRSFTSGFWM